MTGVFIRDTGGSHMKMEVETGERNLQVKECRGPPEPAEGRREARKRFSLRACAKDQACPLLDCRLTAAASE